MGIKSLNLVNAEFWDDGDNPIPERINARMQDVAQLTENTLVILYHSGHGLLFDGASAMALPYSPDSANDDIKKSIVYPYQKVFEQLVIGRPNLFILSINDACREKINASSSPKMVEFEGWQVKEGPSPNDDGSFMLQFGCVAGQTVDDVTDAAPEVMERLAKGGVERLSCQVVKWLLYKCWTRY